METKKTTVPVKVRNWLNRQNDDTTSEKENVLPSMTVPDQALTISEIYQRMQMGLPPEGERVPVFDEGSEFPDLSNMDLVDRAKYIEFYKQELAEIGEKIKAGESAKDRLLKERDDKKASDDAFEELLKAD